SEDLSSSAESEFTASSLGCGGLRRSLAEHPLENRIDVLEMITEVEVFLKLRGAQMPAHVVVGHEQGEEIAFALPCPHGVALYHRIGGLARNAFLRECDERTLRMDQAAEPLHVLQHVGGIDDELVDDRGKTREREIERGGGVGRDHALDRGVRDVALVPESHVLQCRR